MRKLKLVLLGIVSIFCLNSCITTALSTLAGLAIAVCGENGCNDFGKKGGKKDYGGIYVLFKEDDLKTKKYLKSLLSRSKEKLEIDKGIFVNVPQGFILKKDGKDKYFYDKINDVGFSIVYGNNEKIKRIYENEDLTYKTKLISEITGARIYKVEDKVESQNIDSFLIKKVLNGKYIYISLYVSRNDKNISEFMEFYKDFMENL